MQTKIQYTCHLCFIWQYQPCDMYIHLHRLYFEPSQIATVTNCDTTVTICDLLQFMIKALTAQTESNNTENVFWVLGRVPRFTFDMNMKSIIFAQFGVISLLYLFVCMYISYKAHNRFTKETLLIVSDVDCTCFLYWGVYPLALRTWIWEVAFWTVTKCDSHKLRQFRNPCRRILWFVAFCDHGRDGTHWVQKHWKRVLGTWESTQVHFWHEYEKYHFCPIWRYFTVISVCVCVYQL